jgi:hypothetical protein
LDETGQSRWLNAMRVRGRPMRWSGRWERSTPLLVWAFDLPTVPNTIGAFADPEGLVWDVVRFGPSRCSPSASLTGSSRLFSTRCDESNTRTLAVTSPEGAAAGVRDERRGDKGAAPRSPGRVPDRIEAALSTRLLLFEVGSNVRGPVFGAGGRLRRVRSGRWRGGGRAVAWVAEGRCPCSCRFSGTGSGLAQVCCCLDSARPLS